MTMQPIRGAIWKFEVPYPNNNRAPLWLPRGSQLLSAGVDTEDRIVVWALGDPDEMRNEPRTLIVVNTGVRFDAPRARYLATVRTSTGIVWHLWEEA